MIGAGLPWNDPVSVGDSLRAAGAGGFPEGLSEASEFVGTDIEGSLVRAINHVKLGLVPGGLRAKGYLRIQHRWRPVRQAATSQGQSA